MGPVMLDLHGCELDAEEKELLDHPGVGGVVITSYSIHYTKLYDVSTGAESMHPAVGCQHLTERFYAFAAYLSNQRSNCSRRPTCAPVMTPFWYRI